MNIPEGADRDFTASAFVVDDADRVLLLKHTKLDAWLQPGGHIEPRETPDECALREVREETGVTVQLVADADPLPDESVDLPRPFSVNVHPVREGHWHVDFAFVAEPVEVEEDHVSDEHDGVGWFSLAELATFDDALAPGVPELCRRAVASA